MYGLLSKFNVSEMKNMLYYYINKLIFITISDPK